MRYNLRAKQASTTVHAAPASAAARTAGVFFCAGAYRSLRRLSMLTVLGMVPVSLLPPRWLRTTALVRDSIISSDKRQAEAEGTARCTFQ
jgi:hypothetical protein